MNAIPFKFLPLRKSDFQNQVGYNVKTHLMPTFSYLYFPKKRSYAELLNKLGGYLFPNFNYSNITKPQLIRLNKLIKIGFEIIEQYIPREQHQNICVNLFPWYLERAIVEFYRQNAPAKHLENARAHQNANDKRRKIKFGPSTYAKRVVFSAKFELPDRPSHYIPFETALFMRPRFFRAFGAYPDEIFTAVIFFLIPYILGIRKTTCKCDIFAITSALKSVLQFHNKHLCGLANGDNISFDFVAEYLETSGKQYTRTADIKSALNKDFGLSRRQINAFITYFNNKHNLKRIRDFWKNS